MHSVPPLAAPLVYINKRLAALEKQQFDLYRAINCYVNASACSRPTQLRSLEKHFVAIFTVWGENKPSRHCQCLQSGFDSERKNVAVFR